MIPMEFGLFDFFFPVLLLVIKGGDLFRTGRHFRGVDVQLLIICEMRKTLHQSNYYHAF